MKEIMFSNKLKIFKMYSLRGYELVLLVTFLFDE